MCCDYRGALLAKARAATDRGYQRLQEIKYTKYKEKRERKEAEQQKKKQRSQKGWSKNSESIGQKATMQAEKAVQLAAASGMSPEDLLRFRAKPEEKEDKGTMLGGSKQGSSMAKVTKKQPLPSVSEGGGSTADSQDSFESSWKKKENAANK